MRASLAVLNPQLLLEKGLEIVDRGHQADPRVLEPDPRFRAGRRQSDRCGARLAFACWPAGMLLGEGKDACGILDAVGQDRDREMDPAGVAASLFRSAILPRCVGPEGWVHIWPDARRNTAAFVERLEQISGTPMLARRAIRELEKMIVQTAPFRDLTIGTTATRRIEVTSAIGDLVLPHDIERLHVAVEVEGDHIGNIELPVCDGIVPRGVLRDALVAHHAWPILGRFFAKTVYPSIQLTSGSLCRGPLQLTSDVPPDITLNPTALHDAIGWVVFLQELWGHADWRLDQFYMAPPTSPVPGPRTAPTQIVEASAAVPAVRARRVHAAIVFTIGSAPIAIVCMPPSQSPWTPESVIGACTREAGYEMCRVAVREALLGTSFAAPGGLRERLAAATATHVMHDQDSQRWARHLRRFCGAVRRRVLPGTDSLDAVLAAGDGRLAVGWRAGLGLDTDGGAGTAVIGHRRVGGPGTSASRRAHVPLEVGEVMAALAVSDREPVLAPAKPTRWLYAPGVLWSDAGEWDDPGPPTANDSGTDHSISHGFDRHHFESVFAAEQDPWHYDTAFEQRKYEQTLAIIEGRRHSRVLELACAEGAFTQILAGHVDELLATDISQVALTRARARCASHPNVSYQQLDLRHSDLPGTFDLIVCSEVLYYLNDVSHLRNIARRLADALEPDGILVITHCNVLRDDPSQPGLAWAVPFGAKVIGETIAETPGLQLERELQTALYRVQRFRRIRSDDRGSAGVLRRTRSSSTRRTPSYRLI